MADPDSDAEFFEDAEPFADALDSSPHQEWVLADEVGDDDDVASSDASSTSGSFGRRVNSVSGAEYAAQLTSVFPPSAGGGGHGYGDSSEDGSSYSRSSGSNSFVAVGEASQHSQHSSPRRSGSAGAGGGGGAGGGEGHRLFHDEHATSSDEDNTSDDGSDGGSSQPAAGTRAVPDPATGTSSNNNSNSSANSSTLGGAARRVSAGTHNGGLSGALVSAAFSLQDFSEVPIQMHPRRIAVHPATGKLYHITDYVLMFPGEPAMPFPRDGQQGVGVGVGSAHAVSPRKHALTPRTPRENSSKGRGTSGAAAVSRSARDADTPGGGAAQPQKLPRPKLLGEKKRQKPPPSSRSSSAGNDGGDGSGDDSDPRAASALQRVHARAAAGAGGVPAAAAAAGAAGAAAAAPAAAATAAAASASAASAAASAAAATPADGSAAGGMRVAAAKRATRDIHSLRLLQELTTRSGLICCMALSTTSVYLAAAGVRKCVGRSVRGRVMIRARACVRVCVGGRVRAFSRTVVSAMRGVLGGCFVSTTDGRTGAAPGFRQRVRVEGAGRVQP